MEGICSDFHQFPITSPILKGWDFFIIYLFNVGFRPKDVRLGFLGVGKRQEFGVCVEIL